MIMLGHGNIMNSSQTVFHKILHSHLDESAINEHFKILTPVELAGVYIDSAYLSTTCEYLKEQFWLRKRDFPDKSYEDLLDGALDKELLQVSYLKAVLLDHSSSGLKELSRKTDLTEKLVIAEILSRSSKDQKEFLIRTLESMHEVFTLEEKAQEGRHIDLGHSGPCLYRTFDGLDLIFKLDYQLDKDMVVDHLTKERLYQKSGVGVQSGYSTILLALQHSNLSKGKTLVDLGSGYGRVGLVGSLLWPEVDFIGYEYVSHRVDVSNDASDFLKLNQCKFFTQDLSLKTFDVPEADVYYLYDPFSEETYKYVLDQIIEISKRREITVVTKGNARSWLTKISKELSWPNPTLVDEGNLCIFKTA